MIITWIAGLLSVAFIVGVAIIGPPVIRANLPGAGRRERALGMAGRLFPGASVKALPAPARRRYQPPEVIASTFVWCEDGDNPNLEYSVVIDGVSHRLLPADDPRGSHDPGPGVYVTR